jgi:hypothetical protein
LPQRDPTCQGFLPQKFPCRACSARRWISRRCSVPFRCSRRQQTLLQQPHRLRTLRGCLVPSRGRAVASLRCAASVLQRSLAATAVPPAMLRMSARRQVGHEAHHLCPADAAGEQALSRLPPSTHIDRQREPLLCACFRLGQARRANASRTTAPRQSTQLEPSRGYYRSLPRFALQRACALRSTVPTAGKRHVAPGPSPPLSHSMSI